MGYEDIQRAEQASKDAKAGSKYFLNSSLEGEAKLVNFVLDMQDKYRDNPAQFTASMYALKNRPENNAMSNRVGMFVEDANHDGYLDVTEIWTSEQTGGFRSQHQMHDRQQYQNSSSGSPLENAVKNVQDRNRAVEGKY